MTITRMQRASSISVCKTLVQQMLRLPRGAAAAVLQVRRAAAAAGVHARRAVSTTPSASRTRVAVSFDIDGVLLRGTKPLPHAVDALRRLQAAGIPYVMLTNGGGELESKKAYKLTEALGFPIHEQQVILSHTPLRDEVAKFAGKKIFVLGCRDVVSVARHYCPTADVFDVAMLAADDPSRYPFIDVHHKPLSHAEREKPFAGVFILHDPNQWGLEIQTAIDVIRGGNPIGTGGDSQAVPVFACNPDLIFAGTYPSPRLAGGAFTECLKLMWRHVTGHDLVIHQVGKPTLTTFDFAAQQLARWSAMLHAAPSAAAAPPAAATPPAATSQPFDALFHIGDNPAADIQGANTAKRAGRPWHGILVRTGVFKGTGNDTLHPADVAVDGVKEAIDHVIGVANGTMPMR